MTAAGNPNSPQPAPVVPQQTLQNGARSLADLARGLKRQAGLLGFAETRIAPAVEPGRYPQFMDWLAQGYAGEMNYLAERREAYRHPNAVLDGVRTIAVLALPYSTALLQRTAETGVGRVARYASGSVDYHDWIHDRLKQLGVWLSTAYQDCQDSATQPLQWRGVVDTAPLLEREFAQLAGIGWIGKNTLMLNRTLGSYFFLACLLTNLSLPCDDPFDQDHCGACTACLDACPTNAFVQPRLLDASRCISYMTIEQRGLPAVELRSHIGDWLYGCDVCQEVCPWNRKAPSLVEAALAPVDKFTQLPLAKLLQMNDESFRSYFRKTPFWRAKRRGLIRNAAIVAGNQKDDTCVEPLLALLTDGDELIRAAAVWSLSQMMSERIRASLNDLQITETSPLVHDELARIQPPTE
jgi:epoxyqueuosine reductase